MVEVEAKVEAEVDLLAARMTYFSAAVADARATLRRTTAERPVSERSAALDKVRRVTADLNRALLAPIDATFGFEALIAARLKTKRLLDELTSAVIPSVKDALAAPDWALRTAALDALIDCGERAAPALDAVLEAFDRADGAERTKAVTAIAALRPRTATVVPRLVRALTEPDYEGRRLSCLALAHLGPLAHAAVPALTNALDDASVQIRVNAAYALGAIGPEARAAVPRLLKELDREDWGVLGTIAVALSSIEPNAPLARPRLERWVREGSADMRAMAEDVLKGDVPDWAYPPMPPVPNGRPAVPMDRVKPRDRRDFPAFTKSNWGAEIEGCWLAADAEGAAAYDTDLDHGEAVKIHATLFVLDEANDVWSLMERLRLTLRITADGLPDFVRTVECDQSWIRSRRAFGFTGFEARIALHDLFAHWGGLPAEIRVSTHLDHPPLPAVVAQDLRIALHKYAPFDGSTESRPAGAAKVDWRCDIDGSFQLKRDEGVLFAQDQTALNAAIQLGARTPDRLQAENDMIYAARDGRIDRVKRVLDRGADVDARLSFAVFLSSQIYGCTALMLAAMAGNDDIVSLLIARGASLELVRRGRTALELAIERDHEGTAALLTAAGAKGDTVKRLAARKVIRAACRDYRHVEGSEWLPWPGLRNGAAGPSLQALLDQGGDVDSADNNGYTALMYAANLGQVEAVRLLLARGADPARRLSDGTTALDLAARSWVCAELDSAGTILSLLKTTAESRPKAK